jgi:hypothetical protein
MDRIKKFENFKFDGEKEILLSNLLNEIQDKSLQMILRRFIFNNEDLKKVVSEERPELNNDEFNKLRGR